jgi:DNA-binding transcriptional MerR regulator
MLQEPLQERIYSISRAAGLVECPAQWLRDRDDILQPLKDEAGRRVYTEQHIERARSLRQQLASRNDSAA